MDSFRRTIIALIKSAIYGDKTEIPEDFDWGKAERFLKSQEIYELVYYGLVKSGVKPPEWLERKFFERVISLTTLWEQSAEIAKKFDECGIEYVMLKGVVIKDLYPEQYMRHMSDADILIHEEDYKEKIRPVMLELGYAEGVESDHELHWKKNGQAVELHKRLIPSYNKDFYRVIGDGWEWLSKGNFYNYLVAHFAKHYRDGGIGISHFIDLEICGDKIDAESLTEINLKLFYENLRRTLDCWFHGREFDAITEFITEKLFTGGQYGTPENARKSASLKKINASGGSVAKARFKQVFITVFPPFGAMNKRYKVLNRLPVLLPVFWVWRLICAPFRGNVKKNIDSTKAIKQSDYKSELEFVGLDYWF